MFFHCGPRRSPVLHNISFAVGPKVLINIIKHDKSNGDALSGLLRKLCRPRSNQILISNFRIEDTSLDSLQRRVSIILRSSFVFGDSIIRGVALNGPSIDTRTIITTTRGTTTRNFVDSLPHNCRAGINRQNATLSKKRQRHVTLTQFFLSRTPVLVLSRTADTLSDRARRAILAGLRHATRSHAILVVARHFRPLGQTSLVLILSGKILMRRNGRAALVRRRKLC